jgi:hypothetical protein
MGTRVDPALTRLGRRYCVTKREIVECLIAAEDERIASDIALDSPE